MSARRFCQVIKVGLAYAVVAPSAFASHAGICLREFGSEYDAGEYAKTVNSLARAYRDPRAQAAKEKA